jgi:hypothetical protein
MLPVPVVLAKNSKTAVFQNQTTNRVISLTADLWLMPKL